MLAKTVFYSVAFFAALAFATPHPHGIVAYWGQNSGLNQQPLRYYCDKDSIDTVVLAFVNGFPELIVNFSNMCGDTFESGLLHCPQIGEDIKYCQLRGKLVLLSLGGASGSYGFKDDQDARDFAQVMYDTFGPGKAKERPFDDAVVNGYDLDMEARSTGYVAFANELNQLHLNVDYPYFLSATPQCPYPDAALGDVLEKAQVNAVFIQFYNNPGCSLTGNLFNFMKEWKNYADTIAPNKNTLLFIGLPGAQRSAGSGYVSLDQVKAAVGEDILDYDKFGGFMLWDASSLDGNRNEKGQSYDEQLVEFLSSGKSNSTKSN